MFLTSRMGLAISLVATEKEKVSQQGGLISHIIFFILLLFFLESECQLLKKQYKTKQTLAQRKQVWYHVCPNRGRGCYNTRLKEDGGCTIWYNEKEVRRDASTNPVPQ